MNYVFESETQVKNFFKNVQKNLKKNGIFIGTYMDGEVVKECFNLSIETQSKNVKEARVYRDVHFSILFGDTCDWYGFYLDDSIGQQLDNEYTFVKEYLIEDTKIQ